MQAHSLNIAQLLPATALEGLAASYPFRILWHVRENSLVVQNQLLAVLMPAKDVANNALEASASRDTVNATPTAEKRTVYSQVHPIMLKCPLYGRVESIEVTHENLVNDSEVPLCIVFEDDCRHEVVIHGLCTCCLKMVHTDHTLDSVQAGFISNAPGVLLSKDCAAKMEFERVQTLLESKKLCLVLDLDNTLLHSSHSPPLSDLAQFPLLALDTPPPQTVAEDSGVSMPKKQRADNPLVSWMSGYDVAVNGYPHYAESTDNAAQQKIQQLENSLIQAYLKDAKGRADIPTFFKLRPNVINFLRAMSSMYELYLFTMGTAEYAHLSLQLIDPRKHFFGNRVFSRNDGSGGFKSIKRIFPFHERTVVVVDDSEHVWSNISNCIKVHGYYFFPMLNIFDISQIRYPEFSRCLAMIQSYCHWFAPSVQRTIQQQMKYLQWPYKGFASVVSDSTDSSSSSTDTSIRTSASVEAPILPNPFDLKDTNEATNRVTQSNGCCHALTAVDNSSNVSLKDTPNRTTHSPDNDKQLLYLEGLLCAVHKVYFILYEQIKQKHISTNTLNTEKFQSNIPNVTDILQKFRQKTLEGVVLKYYWSLTDFSAPAHWLDFSALARNFGAKLSVKENDASPTHQIYFADEKHNEALSNELNLPMLHLMWLEYAVYTWSRPADELFLYKNCYRAYRCFWDIVKDITFDEIYEMFDHTAYLSDLYDKDQSADEITAGEVSSQHLNPNSRRFEGENLLPTTEEEEEEIITCEQSNESNNQLWDEFWEEMESLTGASD